MFEGNPENCGFNVSASWELLGVLSTSDAETISYLVRVGVDYPTIFSLVWGHKMGVQKNHLFPAALQEIVRDIEECIKKKEAAFDIQEQKIWSIMLDLLQMMYEKQVNDIVEVALK